MAQPECSKPVYGRRGLVSTPCQYRAKVNRGGRWYCGRHDPEVAAKRLREREIEYDKMRERKDKIYALESRIERLGRAIPAIAKLYRELDELQ